MTTKAMTTRRALTLEKSTSDRPTPQRDPRQSWAYQVAADSDELAQIHRVLQPGNYPDDPTASWDPMVCVFFALQGQPELHPDDPPANIGDGWQGVRWSRVNDLIEALLDARDAALSSGMLPRPLTIADYLRKVKEHRNGGGAA